MFSQLIAAFGEARLRQHLEEQRVLRVDGPADLTALLRFDEFSAALAQGVFAPDTVRVIGGRRRLEEERVGFVRDGQVVPSVLEQLARQGVTIVVDAANHDLPALWDLCSEGEALTGDRFAITAFASFGSESGFMPHYDGQDLIVLQLAGAKSWHFHGEPAGLGFPRSGSQGDVEPGPVTHTEKLHAGEIMYVPAGLHHHCSADGASMHLSVIWHRRYGASLAQRLLRKAAKDALLTSPIDLMPGPDAVAERVAAYKARLIELIGELDASGLLEVRREEAKRPATRPSGPSATGPRLAVELPAAA